MAAVVLCMLLLITAAGAGREAGAVDTIEPHRRTATIANRSSDLITKLPGLNYNPGFRQYSGYLTVSLTGRNIFYWYVESQNNPVTDPLILWTNGGPGCSGLVGLLEEHGPYIIDAKLQLSPNPYSWNKVANMLYIEQPAGTGFSFAKNSSDYITGDNQAAKDNYQLILAFLKRFPERKSNDLYIASESYGGHYMPQLALEILRRNTNGALKFKGFMVGNPYVDPFSNTQAEINAYYFHGLLQESQYQSWQKHCSTRQSFASSNVCNDLYYQVEIALSAAIDPYGLDYPTCPGSTQLQESETMTEHNRLLLSIISPQALQLKRKSQVGVTTKTASPLSVYQPCSGQRAKNFLNQISVKRALHVDAQWSDPNWGQCNGVVDYSISDKDAPQISLYKKLVATAKAHEHSLHMLIYSGDDDAVCATSGTQSWIWQLGVSGKSGKTWVPWSVGNQQTAGYFTQFDLGQKARAKFTFATVHGAGHQVPAFRPKEALELLKMFISGTW